MKKLILSTLIAMLASCSSYETIKHNYHEIKDHLISLSDIFIQEEDTYLVYFYSERCGHCNELKQDILSYYFKQITPMYFICTDIEIVTGPPKDLLGISDINEFYIFGTPFLTLIKDGTVADYYVGKVQILDFISI